MAILLVVLAPPRLLAATYEGTVGKQPVWMDLSLPDSEGTIRGSCLYMATGRSLVVEGGRNGKTIRLRASDSTKAEVGIFRLSRDGDRLFGRWNRTRHRSTTPVALRPSDPRRLQAFRDSVLLDAYDQSLMERSFSAYLDDTCYATEHHVELSRGRLRTVSMHYETTGCFSTGYGSEETIVSTYDIETKEEIDVLAEIDSSRRHAFDSLLRSQAQEILSECRSGFPDSEWIAILSGWPLPHDDPKGLPIDPSTADGLDAVFTLGDSPLPPTGLSLLSEGLEITFGCGVGDYFGFPHAWHAMDVCGKSTLPYQAFDSFLKPTSKLRSLCAPPHPAP